MADHQNNNNAGRDWSSLPVDVLRTIADNFLPLPDYIHFLSVCKSWAKSVPPISIPSPLLLLPGNGRQSGHHTANSLAFCSPASPETTFNSPTPPGIIGTLCVGSHDGWLALCYRTLELFLLNPFTGDRIDLPPFTSFPKFVVNARAEDGSTAVARGFRSLCCSLSCCEPDLNRIKLHHRCYIRKTVFNSSPTPQNLMAVALTMVGGIAYTRASEGDWQSFASHTDVYAADVLYDLRYINDVLFHDGRFWAINQYGKLFAFDLRGEGLPEVLSAFNSLVMYTDVGLGGNELMYGDKYLAVGNAGNIVMVFVDRGEYGTELHTKRLIVIEFVGPEFDRAYRVMSLGGHLLLVGNNNGFFLSTEEGHGLRDNCVFLTAILHDTRSTEYGMGVFDMGNESFELLFPQHTEYKRCRSSPVWFTPSTKRNNLESSFSQLAMS